MTTEKLVQDYEYMNDTQKELIDTLIGFMNKIPTKHDIIKASNKLLPKDKKVTNYDTAYPIQYYRAIEEIYPNIQNANMIMDYTTNRISGSILNINDLFMNYIFQSLKS